MQPKHQTRLKPDPFGSTRLVATVDRMDGERGPVEIISAVSLLTVDMAKAVAFDQLLGFLCSPSLATWSFSP
jgi:hypothetical protein